MSNKILSLFLITILFVSSTFALKNGDSPKLNNNKIGIDSPIFDNPSLGSANGGSNCATCTLLLTLVEQYSLIHEKSIQASLNELCTFLPSKVRTMCSILVLTYGQQVISLFDKYEHADDVCHALPKMCTSPTCRLFPNKTPTYVNPLQSHKEYDPVTYTENPWDWFKSIIFNFTSNHLPMVDLDKDYFSEEPAFRGYSWRGKDCNDVNKDVYPGAGSDPTQPYVDWDCNGINGTNPSGVSWEEELCSNSGAMGVVVAGDSAGAHFSIPPEWLTAALVNKTTYKGMFGILENEVDWPHRSAYTGWEPSTPQYTVDSVYLRMRERNLCNHRDYQNLGVNGCSSNSMIKNVIQSISRNQEKDKPVLFFLELIGNDVCNGRHDLDHMTTVEQFGENIVQTLEYLDTVLPMGSHVVFVGLADGRVLWDSLWNRTHPIGATYEEVYNFLNCLEVSPCWGWMNPNETIRDQTSARAQELSDVYPEIIKNYTFVHFDMQYYDFPFNVINQQWVAQGGQTWELIEPVDGFHPNQITNYLMGGYFFNQLMNDHPDWLGQVNPNNAFILQTFGNQGGYV
eukprot:gene3673-4575_t